MNQYLAVASQGVLPGIKRHLVFFDRVAVVQSNNDWYFRAEDPSLAADLDWLENKGLVIRVEEFLKRECGFEFVTNPEAERGKRILIKLSKLPKHKIEEVREARLGREFIEKFNGKTIRYIMNSIDDLACRWEAQRLAGLMGAQTVSLSSPHPEVNELLGVKTERGDVLRVLLKEMPEPSDTTSLEQILQFREDPDSKNKMFAFRRWVQTMVTKGLPAKEIGEELEWMAHQYEEHMRLHKMRVNKGIVEIVITTAAEIAEDLVKIRWGKLSKLPFTLTHRKIDLLEAELKAPGREISYVVQARKALSK